MTSGPRITSKPPINSPDTSREALVYIQFMVSATGMPENIEVMQERGFHTEPFRNTALDYVRALRFEPAMAGGVAISYGPVVLPLSFGSTYSVMLLPEEQGVTPAFRRELNKVTRLLKAGKFEDANRHAEWMLRDTVKLRYEFAALQAQLAQTYAAVGNLDAALEAASAATSRTSGQTPDFRLRQAIAPNKASNYLLPKEAVTYLLEMKMRLEAQSGELVRALKTYNELAGLTEIRPEDPRASLAETLAKMLESGKVLLVNGRVSKEYWSHDLFHPRFAIQNLKGRIDNIHLHCSGGFREFNRPAGTAWEVPAGLDNCRVEFYAEPGTTFELLEVPASGEAIRAN